MTRFIRNIFARWILIPAAVVFILTGSRAMAGIAIKAEVDRKAVSVGEPLTLTVTVDIESRGSYFSAPEPVLPSFDGFTRMGSARTMQTQILQDRMNVRVEYRIQLAPVREGLLRIPPIRVEYKDPDTGNTVEAASDPIQITVGGGAGENNPEPGIQPENPPQSGAEEPDTRSNQSASPEQPQQRPQPGAVNPALKYPKLRDIKGPLILHDGSWILVLLISAAAGLIAAITLLLMSLNRKEMAAVKPKPVKPFQKSVAVSKPEQEAIAMINQLLSDSAAVSDEVFATRLSMILRTLLNIRFAIPAIELTTPEIENSLHARRASDGVVRDVRGLFYQLDVFKFARVYGIPSDRDSLIDSAMNLIRKIGQQFQWMEEPRK